MFALITPDGIVSKYPYTWPQFVADNNNSQYQGPQPSLPDAFMGTAMHQAGYTVAPVQTQPSNHDPRTHEAVELPPGQQADGSYSQVWEVRALDPADVAQRRAQLLAKFIRLVDSSVDQIYIAVIGQRGPEYLSAEADAMAYRAAGYTGAPPDSVRAWQDAQTDPSAPEATAQGAADSILAKAAAWRDVQNALRAARLKAKADAALPSADLVALEQSWLAYRASIRALLKI